MTRVTIHYNDLVPEGSDRSEARVCSLIDRYRELIEEVDR